MFEVLASLFRGLAPREPAPEDALVHSAIEATIDGTDPRFRAVSGYRRKLKASVEQSIAYVREIHAVLANPLELSRRTFAADPQVHAFFVAPGEVDLAVRDSRQIRDYLSNLEGRQQARIYAAMRMNRSEKRTIAPVLRGDVMQTDVMRTAVNFADNEIVLPANSIDVLKREIEERVFMGLVACALKDLVGTKERKTSLEKDMILLRRKLGHLRDRRLGLEPLAIRSPDIETTDQVEQRLIETERELQVTTASLATINDHLTRVAAVMASPQDHLRFVPGSDWVTPMGFKAESGIEEESNEVHYTEVEADDTSFVVRLVEFDWRPMFPAGHSFD